MKRQDFLKLFDPININKEYKYCCDVQMDNSSTDEEVFKKFIKTFPVNIEDENKSLFKVFPDWMFMEDNPEIDGWRYQVEVNLNELYDNLNIADEKDLITIVRLCNEDNKGIYSMGLGYKFLEAGMSPHDDKNLKMIFTSMSTKTAYTEKWRFACKDTEQLKLWLNNEKIINEMENKGLKLAEITLPKDFVIEGEDQVIYKLDKVQGIEFKSLTSIVGNNIKRVKVKI